MHSHQNYESIEIIKIKTHLQTIFPQAQMIDIKIEKIDSDQYTSFIRILAPERRDLVVHKTDNTAKKSLDKAYHAMLKQTDRIKDKWDKKHNKEIEL